ncbi:hypothetical protein LZ554_007378 [Drepanopeziza brunnea f. sp. 'monogermtubi']|nr:hypothetical protein LZ554_007378 [Drepanopeziza brunnea f. sp. 'monogermtubi']
MKCSQPNRPHRRSWYVVYRVALLAVQAFWFFFASELFDVLFQVAWFSLSIIWTVQDRNLAHSMMLKEDRKTEDMMGSGQLVPILLLVLPAMPILETFYGKSLQSYQGFLKR